MKTSVVAFTALASVAYAQLSAIPSCALSCLTSAITGDGCSGLTDFACHCGQSSLVSQVTPCVQSNCSADEIEETVTAVENLCSEAGVPITITVGGGSSAAASSTAAASSAAASTPASTPAESSAAASTPAAYSSAVVTSATGTGASYPTSNGTVTTPSPSQFTGAANSQQFAAGFLGAAMAVAAVAGL